MDMLIGVLVCIRFARFFALGIALEIGMVLVCFRFRYALGIGML